MVVSPLHLSTDAAVLGTEDLVEVDAQRQRAKFDLVVSGGSAERPTKMFMATIDLYTLGWGVTLQRYLGNIKSVYVMGKPDVDEDITGMKVEDFL